MIHINGLTKKYVSNRKSVCVALNDIHLVLPDTGLVFILGKSGSGKSTLLNLIGGLDSFDGGDIVCFSNSLKRFSSKDFEAYRSHLVSFIFQDYHLLDELTVWENVTLLSSDAQNEKFFLQQLEAVGISELRDRYPHELSGGQRQRVAIARALAKKPRIVLCDEPTGNLDAATSEQILKLLKELSRDQLVLVVSHNVTDANTYADRIVELADGKVVSDLSRVEGYRDELLFEQQTATIPYHAHLSETDLDTLNTAIRDGRVTNLKINDPGFKPTDITYKPKKQKLSMRKIRRENVRALFKKFFMSGAKGMLATVLLSTLMFGVFAVIQSFIQYDPTVAIQQAAGETDGILAIERKYSDYPLSIYDDLSVFANEKAYYLYPQSTLWTNGIASSWDSGTLMSESRNFSELYVHENYGLMLCDEDYLTHVYGQNGEIPLTAGALDYSYQTGILITDYFADSIIFHEAMNKTFRYNTHPSLIGTFVPAGANSAGYICGIIDTDYEEKYKSVFEKYEQVKDSDQEYTQKEIEEMVFKSPDCIAFIDDVKMHLGVAYSLNPNYIRDFNAQETTLVWSKNLYLSNGVQQVAYASPPNISVLGEHGSNITSDHFSDGEIGLPYALYNKLFGTEYTTEDIYDFDLLPEQTVTLTRYRDDNPKKEVVYTKTLTVTCLTGRYICLSKNNIVFMKQHDWHPSRVYFKDAHNVSAIVSFMEENDYEFISKKQETLRSISSLLNSFKPLFELIEYTTVLLIASYLVIFGVKSIRSSRYQIGVIKALGGNSGDISKIFVLNTLIVGIASSAICVLASIPIVQAANNVLIRSIQSYVKLDLGNYEIIKVFPSLLIADALVMIGISFISALLPVLFLKRIKPVEIIKAKE